jgi:hypothetical protein
VVTTRTLSFLRLADPGDRTGAMAGQRFDLFVEMTLSIITASRHVDDGHSVDVT